MPLPPNLERWKDLFTEGRIGNACAGVAQRAIYHCINSRGYYQGWSTHQLLSRHAAKILEESVELTEEAWLPWPLRFSARLTGWLARRYFDDRRPNGIWLSSGVGNLEAYRKELADVQVVILSAGEVAAVGSRYNVIKAALDKAIADIERGVRAT